MNTIIAIGIIISTILGMGCLGVWIIIKTVEAYHEWNDMLNRRLNK